MGWELGCELGWSWAVGVAGWAAGGCQGRRMCSKHCVLSIKVPRSLVSRSVWKPDMHFDRVPRCTQNTHLSVTTATMVLIKGF